MFHVKQKKDEVKRCVMYCDDENEGGYIPIYLSRIKRGTKPTLTPTKTSF